MSLLTKIALGVLLTPVFVYGVLVLFVGRAGVWEFLFGPVERQTVDFASLQLKKTPNQYLVCPPDYCSARPRRESPVFSVPAAVLRDRWLRMMEGQPRVTLLAHNPQNNKYEFEVRTPVLLFPDTVTVQFVPLDEDRSTLAIYSRSHYGYSDLGVNERRVKQWLGLLEKLAAQSGG